MYRKTGIGLFIGMIVLVGLIGAQGMVGAQQEPDLSDYRATMIRLIGVISDARQGAVDPTLIQSIQATGDPLYIAPLVDAAYFARDQELNRAIFAALSQLIGEPVSNGWPGYFEWAGRNDVDLPPGYDEFKGLLLSIFVDPEFARFFQPGVIDTARINMAEVVWGGVRVDGIPSLVNARQITPEEAAIEGETFREFCREGDCAYPAPDELVFGVSIDGDNRAYPLRQLNWHEMFNDVIGYSPLYNTPDGEVLCNFRAPVAFTAVARQGDDWAQVIGESAGCVSEGDWLPVSALQWSDNVKWNAVKTLLPDVAAGTSDPLPEHEGVTGQVMGKAVMLAYCTLCGSGILYDVTIPDLIYTAGGETVELGQTVLEFGSSGLLMRSNKLMYDRTTDTIWNALTGEPAFGPLTTSDILLPLLPVVVSDWGSWLAEHPDTSVLSLDTGYRRDYSNGGAYGDYFNDPDFIMFPVWQQDTSEQANKEIVFALNLDATPKAYPLRLLIPEVVTNDTLAGTDLVIVSRETPRREFFEPGGATVRAYQRGDHVFSPGGSTGEIVDEAGEVWQVTEAALKGPEGETLERLPGHLAFWFGWYGFYPETLVYSPE